MAVAWLLVIMVVAIFVSMVLLAVVCVRCRTNGPLVSIRQASDEPTGIIRPVQPTIVYPSPNQLSPISASDNLRPQQKHRSFTTETESNPSYENPADGPDYINESDGDESGYIVVLPEGEARPADQSRPSTPSSDNLHDYENIPKDEEAALTNKLSVSPSPTRLSESGEEDDRDYLNVDPLHFQISAVAASSAFDPTADAHLQLSSEAFDEPSSDSDSDSEDDDDDEGNYVNVNDSAV